MDAREMEDVLRNLDRRTERIEQILPTLLTRDEAFLHLATKGELQATAARLATKEELQAAVATLATKEELRAAVATLATKEELRAAVATLATKEELRAAVATLATKEELQAGLALCATKDELRAESSKTRRHMDVLVESVRDDIRILAEGVVALDRRVDRIR